MQMLFVSTLVAITFSTPLPLNPGNSGFVEVADDDGQRFKTSETSKVPPSKGECPGGYATIGTEHLCKVAARALYNTVEVKITKVKYEKKYQVGCYYKPAYVKKGKLKSESVWFNINGNMTGATSERFSICEVTDTTENAPATVTDTTENAPDADPDCVPMSHLSQSKYYQGSCAKKKNPTDCTGAGCIWNGEDGLLCGGCPQGTFCYASDNECVPCDNVGTECVGIECVETTKFKSCSDLKGVGKYNDADIEQCKDANCF